MMSTFASSRKNRSKNKKRRTNKNRLKYLPKDGHGVISKRLKQTGRL